MVIIVYISLVRYATSVLIVVQVLGANMNNNANEAKSDNADQTKPSKISSGQPEVPPVYTGEQNQDDDSILLNRPRN